MARLLYAKYCTDRNKKYAISTGIFQDGSRKIVEKKALFPEGRDHIHALQRNYTELSRLLENSPIRVQKIIAEKEDSVSFEYIEGNTLEDRLNHLLAEGKIEEVISGIEEYFGMIRKACGTEAFKQTEAFEQMFGKVDLPKGLHCAKINNVDYGFGNIILHNEEMVLIDYEWCFDFPVPVEFILFRALLYFAHSSPGNAVLLDKGVIGRFGFEENDRKTYTEMEDTFQRRIKEGSTSLGELKGQMLQQTINLHEMYREHLVLDKDQDVQIYYDYGEGFFHENSFMSKVSTENGKIRLEIRNIPENAERIRIDIRKNRCLLVIHRIEDEKGRDLTASCDVHGDLLGESTYVCNVPDPWIVIPQKESREIQLVFDVLEITDDDIIQALQDGTKTFSEQKNTIEQKENYIGEQREVIGEREKEIRELNGIIEQKENYIGEQREVIGDREKEIRELNGIIEQKENYIGEQREVIREKENILREMADTLRVAAQDSETGESELFRMMGGFFQNKVVQKMFQYYGKRRMRKNGH